MNELMSPGAFKAFLSILTAGLSGPWLIYDSFNLIRSRKLDGRDPIVRDKRFGYVIGIAIGIVGVLGTLRFNNVI